MLKRTLILAGAAVAVAVAVPLAAPAAPSRGFTPAASRPTRTATANPPHVHVTLDRAHMTLAGSRWWRSGAVSIDAVTRAPDQELTLLRFRPGYGSARFLADGRVADGHSPAARAALHRIFTQTIFLGGVDVFPGKGAGFIVTVRPGTYYLAQLGRRPNLIAIHVDGAAGPRAPSASALVTASDSGFQSSSTSFPAHGRIAIRNSGSRVHRLSLVPVKPGTTRPQLEAYLRKTGASEGAPPPPFALRGPQLGTAGISPGQRMQLSYSLPPGEYALIDFGQNLANGKPEALEGLYALTTLQ